MHGARELGAPPPLDWQCGHSHVHRGQVERYLTREPCLETYSEGLPLGALRLVVGDAPGSDLDHDLVAWSKSTSVRLSAAFTSW